VRYRCVVRGKVQGVGFRAATRHQARKLGLQGWVRNLPDGSVEAAVEGPPEKLRALVAWLAHGPPAAKVADVTTTEEPEEGLQGFEIRR
jgi:acylphosphatase